MCPATSKNRQPHTIHSVTTTFSVTHESGAGSKGGQLLAVCKGGQLICKGGQLICKGGQFRNKESVFEYIMR